MLARLVGGAQVHLRHGIPESESDGAFHIPLPDRAEVEAKANRWAERAFEKYLRGEDVREVSLVRVVRYGNPARLIRGYAGGGSPQSGERL